MSLSAAWSVDPGCELAHTLLLFFSISIQFQSLFTPWHPLDINESLINQAHPMNLLHLFPLVAVFYSWYCPSAPNLPYEGEKCFHFSMRPEEFQLNFDAAQTACQKLGGSLASITSKFQYDYIKGIINLMIFWRNFVFSNDTGHPKW